MSLAPERLTIGLQRLFTAPGVNPYDEVVWDRREQGFPEPTAVKQAVRDRVAPEKSLGHSDK